MEALANNLYANIVSIIFAALLLWKGADWIVEAATRIARTFGISDLVIGLTIVAFGTSAPEFAVTISGAVKGNSNIAVGNIVGSNIFNLGFILGGCAAVIGFKTTPTIVYRDGLFLFAVTVLLRVFLDDGALTRLEGGIMFGLLIAYLAFLFIKKETLEEGEGEEDEGKAVWSDYLWLVIGIVAVGGGGFLMEHGAVFVARWFEIPEWAIDVTVVAAATSLPEFVTSMTAIYRGQHGMSIGNLIGSDLFNLLGVLGVGALIRPLNPDPAALGSTLMLSVMVLVVVIFMRTGWRVSRGEGIFLVLANLIRWIYDFSQHGGPSGG